MYYRNFTLMLPLQKGLVIHLNKFEPLKEVLYQVEKLNYQCILAIFSTLFEQP